MRFLLFLLFAVLPGFIVADITTSSSVEREIIQHVDMEYERAVGLLETSVNINSGTMNLTGVVKVGDVFMREFNELGFNTSWVNGGSFERAGHLVATRHGSGPKILLVGHLDTVFPVDSPFQAFERVGKHLVRGPGVTDMKGGNVVMIQALRALQAADRLDSLSITAILIGDEESSGRPLAQSKKALIDAAIWADFAVGFEDGDGNPETAVISRRGSSRWTLQTTGKAGHSSQVFQPEYGYGAVYEAARILDQFRRELSTVELLTFNPGMILGGTDVDYDRAISGGSAFGKANVIAQSVRVSGDIRTISPQQLADAQEEMRRIVAEHLPLTDATLVFDEGYPPMDASSGNQRLLEMFDQASREHELGAVRAVNPRNAGAADISFTAEHVKMAIDGVGLMGSGGHTVDEQADLRTLPQQTKRVAVLLHRLADLQ